MFGILYRSLEKLDSLEHFYNSIYGFVFEEFEKGVHKNHIGTMAYAYFSALAMDNNFDKDEKLNKIKNLVENYYEISKVKDKSGDENGKYVTYHIKDSVKAEEENIELDVHKAFTAYKQSIEMPVIHSGSTIIMLITRFEEFISSLLHELYLRFPHKYLDKQQVSYSEIINCGIEEVEEKITQKVLDGVMRESYKEWFDILESHGMHFDHFAKEIGVLHEMYYRRNIIVHNSGRVNNIYLEKVDNTDAQLGEILYATPDYVRNGFLAVRIIILCIMIEAVRIVRKDDRAEYLNNIFNIAFEKLVDREYYLCRIVFTQLEKNKELDAEDQIMAKVNRWIATIQMDGLDDVKKEIEEFDVSAYNEQFKLAKEVLLGNIDQAIVILQKVFPDTIDAPALEKWPLFLQLRETEQYKAFKTQHAEEFKISSVEISKDNNCDETTNSNNDVLEVIP